MNTSTSACTYSETTLLFRKTEVCAIDPRVEITSVSIGPALYVERCIAIACIMIIPSINDPHRRSADPSGRVRSAFCVLFQFYEAIPLQAFQRTRAINSAETRGVFSGRF